MTHLESPGRAPSSPRFLIIFLGTLLLVSALVFIGFSQFQRLSAAARQDQSRRNLEEMGAVLRDYATSHSGDFPPALNLWLPGLDPKFRVNPTWPDEPGYTYLPGTRHGDPADSILVFENTPERKRKLGIFALLADGRIIRYSDAELTQRLEQQARERKAQGRYAPPELLINTV